MTIFIVVVLKPSAEAYNVIKDPKRHRLQRELKEKQYREQIDKQRKKDGLPPTFDGELEFDYFYQDKYIALFVYIWEFFRFESLDEFGNKRGIISESLRKDMEAKNAILVEKEAINEASRKALITDVNALRKTDFYFFEPYVKEFADWYHGPKEGRKD